MKFYLATTFGNHRLADAIADRLIACGYEQTFRWTLHHPDSPRRMVVTEADASGRDLGVIAVQEVEAVKAADVLVVLEPAKDGTHTELGVALAAGVPVILVGEGFDAAMPFYYHPRVTRMAVPPAALDVEGALVPMIGFVAAGRMPAVPAFRT